MKTTQSLLALSAAIFLCAVSHSASAQSAPAEQADSGSLHQLDHDFDVKPGFRIHVDNPYGNVRLREVPLAAGAEFRVTIQTRDSKAIAAEIKAEPIDGGIALSLVGERSAPEDDPNFLRADFVLGVPDSIELDIRMERGDFTMHGASYPLKLTAREGKINLRTSGPVDINVDNGHVIYNPGGEGAPKGGRIQTSGAPVDVLLRGRELIGFEIISGAAVTTDSLELLQRRSREGRTTTFSTDTTEAVLEIQTDHAPIRIVHEGIR